MKHDSELSPVIKQAIEAAGYTVAGVEWKGEEVWWQWEVDLGSGAFITVSSPPSAGSSLSSFTIAMFRGLPRLEARGLSLAISQAWDLHRYGRRIHS